MPTFRRSRRPSPAGAGSGLRSDQPPATPRDVHAAAVRLLARREFSEADLRRRLIESFDAQEVDAALLRLRDSGAIDDRRVAFAHARTAFAVKRRGRLRVERELDAMDIDPSVAREAIEAALGEVDENALLTREVERRARGSALDQRARRRLYAQLVRQGFPADRIVAALRRRHLEPEDD